MERTIPKPAPDDNPVKYGSANGFLVIACKIIPAMAKDEPAIIAFIVLGILINSKIMELFSGERL